MRRAHAVVAIALIAVAGLFLHRFAPITDGAVYEYAGRAMVHGARLYRDVWDTKLPGVFLVDAAYSAVFGDRYLLHAAAEVAMLVAVAAETGVVAAGRGGSGPLASVLAAAALLLASPQIDTTETCALLPLVGAIVAAQRRAPFLAGVLLGLATFCWIPSLLTLAVLLVVAPAGRRAAALGTAVTLAGGLAALIVIYGPAESHEQLISWWHYFRAKTPSLHPKLGPLAPLGAFVGGASTAGVLALAALASGRVVAPPARRVALVWVACALGGTLVGSRFYEHYFMPTVPALATAIALGRPRAGTWGRVGAPVLAAALVLVDVRGVVSYQRYWQERAWHATRAGALVRLALGHGATIALDDYEPGVYLAADARLRSPIELVADTNLEIAAAHATGRRPGVVIDTKAETAAPAGLVEVCAATAPPWRFFVPAATVARFRGCVPDSRTWWRQGDSNS